MLLKQSNNKVINLSERDFKNEKELQTFFENNMQEILGLKFVCTEFTVGNFRIDSLVFDEENKTFKIVEYKNVKNHSLVDQGYTYLKLLLERKAEFVLKYNEIYDSKLKISDVDWSQARIIFVSTIFTNYQINATDFKNIPIDLIKVIKYDDDLYVIDKVEKNSNVKIEEINIQNNEVKNINKEIIVYTEEDHLNYTTEELIKVYFELKDRILSLDNIDIDVKKLYIAFKGKTNIADIEFYKRELKVYINLRKGSLKEKNPLLEDVSNIGHHANGDYRVRIKNKEDIEYAILLIKKSLEVNKK